MNSDFGNDATSSQVISGLRNSVSVTERQRHNAEEDKQNDPTAAHSFWKKRGLRYQYPIEKSAYIPEQSKPPARDFFKINQSSYPLLDLKVVTIAIALRKN